LQRDIFILFSDDLRSLLGPDVELLSFLFEVHLAHILFKHQPSFIGRTFASAFKYLCFDNRLFDLNHKFK